MLPSRFVLSGLILYVVLELIGSLLLQYTTFFHHKDQWVIIGLRLSELAGLVYLVNHFRLIESLGLSRPTIAQIQFFIVASLACLTIAGLLYLVQPAWFVYVRLPEWLDGVSGFILMVCLAPVVEEMIFRGLLYRMLREQWGIWVSVTVSAVFFSLLHHGMVISPQFVGGIIFALAYEWSRSLWVSIGLHMGANGAVYILSVLALQT